MPVALPQRLAVVRERVAAAARRAGRDPAGVTVVAVTKDVPASLVAAAVAAGAADIGENRCQEARQKMDELQGIVARWHFIGHLQRNKVKYVVERFAMIHSLDSLGLAAEIDRRARASLPGRRVPVLVEVNIGGEPTKHGVGADDALGFIAAVGGLAGLDVQGLMTVAPAVGDPERARPYFCRLRLLLEAARDAGATGLRHLSMGMTDDFEVAVEEGATLVRVGRAIFGPREASR